MRQEEQAFFEQLYLQLYDGLYRFIARIAKDADAAEDLVQETFTEAFSRIDTLMAHPNVTGWFYLTARNKTLNHLRRKYHQEMTDLDFDLVASTASSDGNSPVETTVMEEFFQFAQLAGYVTEQELAMLKDRFEVGLSLEEIAQRYGLSLGACKMRFSRIYKRLRENPELLRVCVLALMLVLQAKGSPRHSLSPMTHWIPKKLTAL